VLGVVILNEAENFPDEQSGQARREDSQRQIGSKLPFRRSLATLWSGLVSRRGQAREVIESITKMASLRSSTSSRETEKRSRIK
jgi:hypothetical protein